MRVPAEELAAGAGLRRFASAGVRPVRRPFPAVMTAGRDGSAAAPPRAFAPWRGLPGPRGSRRVARVARRVAMGVSARGEGCPVRGEGRPVRDEGCLGAWRGSPGAWRWVTRRVARGARSVARVARSVTRVSRPVARGRSARGERSPVGGKGCLGPCGEGVSARDEVPSVRGVGPSVWRRSLGSWRGRTRLGGAPAVILRDRPNPRQPGHDPPAHPARRWPRVGSRPWPGCVFRPWSARVPGSGGFASPAAAIDCTGAAWPWG
jgi:hypothetical protein